MYCSLSNPLYLLSFCLLCSVHHGCWTAGLPLWPKLLTGQVLLRGLWHLLRWRVPDRLGLHAGYCRSHAHRLLALFCQICTKGAAVPHPFTHAVIVHWYNVLFFPLLSSLSNLGLISWRDTRIPFLKAMLFGKPHSVITKADAQQQTLSSCICYVINSNSVRLNGRFHVLIIVCGYHFYPQIYSFLQFDLNVVFTLALEMMQSENARPDNLILHDLAKLTQT